MIAVVPITSGSKGIVDKNIRPIAGNPLFFWTLDALQWSNVDRIIVAVDLPYVDYINQYKFSKLDVYVRDPKNSRDESATEDVLIELIDSWNLDDDILLAQATSPLTRTKDYNKGIKMYSDYDSIVSVVRQKRFIWNDEGYPSNYNLFNRPRRQDFKGYLVENGAFYIGHSEHIKKWNNRVYGKIGLCEMNENSYLELDSEEDFKIIEKLLYEIRN